MLLKESISHLSLTKNDPILKESKGQHKKLKKRKQQSQSETVFLYFRAFAPGSSDDYRHPVSCSIDCRQCVQTSNKKQPLCVQWLFFTEALYRPHGIVLSREVRRDSQLGAGSAQSSSSIQPFRLSSSH